MFSWGPKYLFAVSLTAFVAAVVYGLVTGGDVVGVLTSGYKGGVGEHAGYAILLGVFVTFQVLCWILVAVRDGDAEALADRVGAPSLPVVSAPADPNPWGPMVAFGLAFMVLGVVSKGFLLIGVALVLAGALQWLLLAWSDRATGDPEANRIIRKRISSPFEVPVLSIIGIAAVVFCASRVFLTTSKTGSVVAGTIITVLVFGTAILASQNLLKPVMTRGLVVVGALALLVGGVVGGVRGERDFEHHGAEHSEDADHGDEGHADEGESGDDHGESEGEGE